MDMTTWNIRTPEEAENWNTLNNLNTKGLIAASCIISANALFAERPVHVGHDVQYSVSGALWLRIVAGMGMIFTTQNIFSSCGSSTEVWLIASGCTDLYNAEVRHAQSRVKQKIRAAIQKSGDTFEWRATRYPVSVLKDKVWPLLLNKDPNTKLINKVGAIRALQAISGAGLKEVKDLAEFFINDKTWERF